MAEDPIRGQQEAYSGPHGVAKAGLSRAGDVSQQCEAGCRVQCLGEGIHQLPHGAKVLAVPIAKVH